MLDRRLLMAFGTELLREALAFASNHTTTTKNEKAIITQAKKSVLFSRNTTWSEKRLCLFLM